MDDQFADLQRLLRLKRHEAPPPEYFEDFLFEFHRRQRAELLRRPLWRLALDRLEGALPTFTPARYAYVGSCTVAVAVAAVMSGHILTNHPGVNTAIRPGLAVTNTANSANFVGPVGPDSIASAPRFDFQGRRPSVRLPELNFDRPRQMAAASQRVRPRYVLDTQPVSYELSSTF